MDDPFPKDMLKSIEAFLATDDRRSPGKDIYQEVFDDPYFFPLQRQREMTRMIQIARSINPKTVMEIGADKAGGLYHWCKSITSVERIIACEIRGTPYDKVFERTFPWLEFLWLPCSSYETGVIAGVSRFTRHGREENGAKQLIDILFIDGDKANFLLDFDCYLPLMNPNGIVFMHDIQDTNPREAYDKVIARGYRHEEIVDIQDWIDSDNSGESVKTAHEGWLRHWMGMSCGVGVIYLSDISYYAVHPNGHT